MGEGTLKLASLSNHVKIKPVPKPRSAVAIWPCRAHPVNQVLSDKGDSSSSAKGRDNDGFTVVFMASSNLRLQKPAWYLPGFRVLTNSQPLCFLLFLVANLTQIRTPNIGCKMQFINMLYSVLLSLVSSIGDCDRQMRKLIRRPPFPCWRDRPATHGRLGSTIRLPPGRSSIRREAPSPANRTDRQCSSAPSNCDKEFRAPL